MPLPKTASVHPAAERRSRSGQADVTVLCLSLRASAEIGVLARVIQHLARRGLLPSRLHGTESGDQLLLDLQIAGVGEREGSILAESLRQVVGIDEVLTSRLLRQRVA
jgi:acetolactate synthase regulatory subunit